MDHPGSGFWRSWMALRAAEEDIEAVIAPNSQLVTFNWLVKRGGRESLHSDISPPLDPLIAKERV
jgi:hypothetical protein